MPCTVEGFVLESFGVSIFPYAQCSPPYYTAGCLKPGSTVKWGGTITNISAYPCKCATLAFYLNGVEMGRKEVCVNSGYWPSFSYFEEITALSYVIPDYGTYNFCCDIVSVR